MTDWSPGRSTTADEPGNVPHQGAGKGRSGQRDYRQHDSSQQQTLSNQQPTAHQHQGHRLQQGLGKPQQREKQQAHLAVPTTNTRRITAQHDTLASSQEDEQLFNELEAIGQSLVHQAVKLSKERLQRQRNDHAVQLGQVINRPVAAKLWGTRGHYDLKWSVSNINDNMQLLSQALTELAAMMERLVKNAEPAAAARTVKDVCPVAPELLPRLQLIDKLGRGEQLATKEVQLVEDLLRSQVMKILSGKVWNTPFEGLALQVQWGPASEGTGQPQQQDLVQLLRQGCAKSGEAGLGNITAEFVEMMLRLHRDQARLLWHHFSNALPGHTTPAAAGSNPLIPDAAGKHPGGSIIEQHAQAKGSSDVDTSIHNLQAWQARVACELQQVVVHARQAQSPARMAAAARAMTLEELHQCAMAVAGEAIRLHLLTTAVHPELVVDVVAVGQPVAAARGAAQRVQVDRFVQVPQQLRWAADLSQANQHMQADYVLANLLPGVRFADGSQVVMYGRVHTTAQWVPSKARADLLLYYLGA